MNALSRIRHPRRWRYERTRRRLAARTIAGRGLEVGALHSPFPVPGEAGVRFVDRFTTDRLRAEYPELADQPLVEVDVVDDGERLSSVGDASQDFVIASHFLEHCEDPVSTLTAHLRVLRPGGTLLLALPDRRRGIDVRRAPTPLDHVVADHEHGPRTSRSEHYRDWARLVDLPLGLVAEDALAAHAAALEQRSFSIHFHCWTPEEFLAQLGELTARYALPVAAVHHEPNHHEFLVALTRA